MDKDIDEKLQKDLSPDIYCLVHNKIVNLEQQVQKQKEVIDRVIELNQMINNSDYVYLQDEITTKNLDILKEVSE